MAGAHCRGAAQRAGGDPESHRWRHGPFHRKRRGADCPARRLPVGNAQVRGSAHQGRRKGARRARAASRPGRAAMRVSCRPCATLTCARARAAHGAGMRQHAHRWTHRTASAVPPPCTVLRKRMTGATKRDACWRSKCFWQPVPTRICRCVQKYTKPSCWAAKISVTRPDRAPAPCETPACAREVDSGARLRVLVNAQCGGAWTRERGASVTNETKCAGHARQESLYAVAKSRGARCSGRAGGPSRGR